LESSGVEVRSGLEVNATLIRDSEFLLAGSGAIAGGFESEHLRVFGRMDPGGFVHAENKAKNPVFHRLMSTKTLWRKSVSSTGGIHIRA